MVLKKKSHRANCYFIEENINYISKCSGIHAETSKDSLQRLVRLFIDMIESKAFRDSNWMEDTLVRKDEGRGRKGKRKRKKGKMGEENEEEEIEGSDSEES